MFALKQYWCDYIIRKGGSVMFEIDLYKKTETDLIIVDCNGNGFPNSEVVYFKGDKNRIVEALLANLLLDEIEIKLDDKSNYVFKCNGNEYVVENIPVVSGIDSFIYHGHEEPIPHIGVEWFYADKKSNSIKIIRLLSTFSSKSQESYEEYFESINDHFIKWISDLNCAINFHNKQLKIVAEKHADYLHNLYVNNPEMLGIKL